MSESITETAPVDPLRNPSYPQRVHIREKGQWQAVLSEWDGKIEAARARLGSDASAIREFARMSGARDQIADSVRRLPMEVGEMYAEDKHRLEEAVAALERMLSAL